MTNAPSRILITGGAGFIGANLAKHVLHTGAAREVRVIDDLSSGSEQNLDGVDVDLHRVSILDARRVSELAEGCDCIVHLAAVPSVPRSIVDPLRSHHTNITGTLHVLEAARAVGAHVILASSSSVYGSNPTQPKSEDLRCMPMSPYAVSKLATEAYGAAYARCFGVPVLAFRLFNVFGPLQPAGHAYAAVVPAFISAALNGQPLQINGDGQQTRDFTYVGTVVETIARAVRERTTYDDAVNLAFGTRTSIVELIRLIEGIMGTPLTTLRSPERPADVRDSQADGTRLSTLFPDIRPVPLEEALRATIVSLEAIETSKTRAAQPESTAIHRRSASNDPTAT